MMRCEGTRLRRRCLPLIGMIWLASAHLVLASSLCAQSHATQELLADTLFFPEGLDVDARSGAIFVTSIATGRIIRVDSTGAVRDVFPAGNAPRGGVFGVAVDSTCACLWVTTAPHPRRTAGLQREAIGSEKQSADRVATLLQVRASDGAILRRLTLGDGTGMPGELAITPGGDVLVSDGVRGVLYRLQSDGDSLETIRDPLLRSPQGIAVSDDGRTAWVADWSRGLLRWHLETGRVMRVQASPEMELRGIDGLRRHGRWLIAVQNGTSTYRVLRIGITSDGRRVDSVDELDVLPAGSGEPTVGAMSGDTFVYVATSQWPFWTNDGSRRGSAPLPTVQLRRVRVTGNAPH